VRIIVALCGLSKTTLRSDVINSERSALVSKGLHPSVCFFVRGNLPERIDIFRLPSPYSKSTECKVFRARIQESSYLDGVSAHIH
jgi:hypothetical protein